MRQAERYDLDKTVRWTLCTSGAIFGLMGVLELLRPIVVIVSVPALMGVGLLLSGANYMVPYISMKNNRLRPKWLLPAGAVDIAFGLIYISRIGLWIFSVPALLGMWLLAAGCVHGYKAVIMMTVSRNRYAAPAAAALILIAALASLSSGARSAAAVALVSGLSLLCAGAAFIAEGKFAHGKAKKSA
ncbi:hypothetical protein FACS1894167_04270 [Synergistales bacterium]|nr:hypothetical protein FACS1894167_04270 [Synergistales bacterium]